MLLLLLVSLPVTSCSTKYKAARTELQHEKRAEERKKEGERAMRQAQKRHVQMQSSQTRQRMNQTRSKSNRLINNPRNKPFYIRWYNAIRGKR
jgi:flagellar biosynthesis protein FlhB